MKLSYLASFFIAKRTLSPIVKMTNTLDKKIHGLIDKQFKHLKIKEEQDKSKSQLSMDDKLKLSDMINPCVYMFLSVMMYRRI